jgi:hypothetical protein
LLDFDDGWATLITVDCYEALTGFDPNIHVFPETFSGPMFPGQLSFAEDGVVAGFFEGEFEEPDESFLWYPNVDTTHRCQHRQALGE